MLSKVYKNLFIVPRGNIIHTEYMNIKFESDNQPFKYTSPDDKIFFC